MSTEVDGLFYDLLRMFLGTLFQLQSEEDEEDASSVIGICLFSVGLCVCVCVCECEEESSVLTSVQHAFENLEPLLVSV